MKLSRLDTWTFDQAWTRAEAFFQGDALRAEVFLYRYALRDLEGRWLEPTPEFMWRRLARTMARVEKDRATWEKNFRDLLEDFRFVPGGRILFGASNPRSATLFNCYFIPIQADSIYGITRWMFEAAKTYGMGGGVGTNADVLRPRGAKVRNAGLESSGSVSFMEVFSTLTGVMGASGGRRGALMITLRVDHPDVLEFITAKSDPERRHIRNANISVRVSDAFMEALAHDGRVRLWFQTPHETIERFVPARQIWQALVESAWASAEPGVLFWDQVVRRSTTQYNGMEVQGVNVCGEVPMEPYGACNLGSINLAAFVRAPFTDGADLDWDRLAETVRRAVRFLDDVIDVGAPRHPLRAQRRASERSRRVGLGIMGLADCMVMLNVVYGSPECIRWVDRILAFIKEAAYQASIDLAREKGPFPAFDARQHEKSPYIQELPAPIRRGIQTYGLRNCALLAIAPTGSISILAGTSSGIEPIFALQYLRHVAGQAYEVEHPLVRRYRQMYGASSPLPPAFVAAHQVDPEARVELQAAAQRHVDQSISSTVNLPEDTPVSTVERLYWKAWELGCKGITVFREGSRASVVEPLHEERGVYRVEAEPPLGVCVVCEVPAPSRR
ncbi:Vitamin B12-dependent ribonucleoside-diphosphate reductase [bacterium HR11]|nr:Vitamin B12-dependent ribonucleoside-diphosphate reductase [bacterium HR11]